MEKKGFKWQMCVGAVFMIIIIISLFLPSMSISGEKYLKTAEENLYTELSMLLNVPKNKMEDYIHEKIQEAGRKE